MAKQMHYTKEGYQALVDELEYLKTTRRAEVKEALAVARSYGDLSENSEYDEARNEQAKVESRITELESLILHAIVVDESEVDHSRVSVGSVVKVQNVKDKKVTEYTIVGTNEVDFWSGKISDQSPIGAAIVGARKGDTVMVESPAGAYKVKILEVERVKLNS
ncbi:MAG: transcription elongation factor GreA [Clostridia bacterium]|nr:transcription elongation factor GreA [Clostridia bacterium]